jgi:hypothetical protein
MEPRALLQDRANKKRLVMTQLRSLSRYNDNIIRYPKFTIVDNYASSMAGIERED